MTILSAKNPCEHFHTKSDAHYVGAHMSGMIALSTDYRRSENEGASDNYCASQMWMSTDEAEAVIRALQDAIACVRAYQEANAPKPETLADHD